MRYPEALSSTLTQNTTLRLVTIVLSVLLLFSMILAIFLGNKAPILIERACTTKALTISDSQARSKEEIHEFINEAIEQRFNSDVKTSKRLLSFPEQEKREKEMAHLASQKMRQVVFINKIEEKKGYFLIEADRLISVSRIRSGFIFPLKITISTSSRSLDNPYGLVLESTEILKENEE